MNAHPVTLIHAHEVGIYAQTSENNRARDYEGQDTLEYVDFHQGWGGVVVVFGIDDIHSWFSIVCIRILY